MRLPEAIQLARDVNTARYKDLGAKWDAIALLLLRARRQGLQDGLNYTKSHMRAAIRELDADIEKLKEDG